MTTRRALLAGAGGLVAARAFAAPARPYWPTAAEWASVTPAAAGLDAARLSAAVDVAMADRSADVLILRGGRLVVERYAEGSSPTRALEVASTGKSMLSVLVGVAIDEGKIKSVDQSVADFIPAWKNTPKAAITVRHLITMTSGLDDTGLALRGVTGDQFALNSAAPQRAAPGTEWRYNTAVYHLLFHVLARATGERFEDFAQRALVGPLGMANTSWVTTTGQGATGPVTNYYTARCSGRDLARFGLFALRGGRWQDRQLVSAKYFAESIRPSQALNGSYGWLWWENARPGFAAAGMGENTGLRFPGSPPDAFAALGAGGQVAMMVPSLDLVVVRQGENPTNRGLPGHLLAAVCAAAKA